MFGSTKVVALTGLVAERAAADVTAATSVVVIGATTTTREPIAHRTGGVPKSGTVVKHAAPRHQSVMAAQAVARAGEECHRRCCWHNPRCLARGPCSGCSAAAAARSPRGCDRCLWTPACHQAAVASGAQALPDVTIGWAVSAAWIPPGPGWRWVPGWWH